MLYWKCSKSQHLSFEFEHIKKENIGITGGRVFVAEHFHESDMDYYMFFEDDMFFYCGEDTTCRNGFVRKTKNLYEKILQIVNRIGECSEHDPLRNYYKM